ncbi:hypothetical protein AOCH_003073 [Aspergillus ochraceoroseus]|nr:hypothetical protein AOCH_003073 [Aspergillus ochraceoroseus]
MNTHNLSQHVHRIGYHFPSAIVATVCMDLGLYLAANGKAIPFHDLGNQASRRRTNSEASQITINTEARDVLKDLFPNIPDNDLNQIIKTAFQKGQRKVGTAVELPLTRRAQLAVVAHIRHIYTDYDRLLKSTSFHEARSTVEEPTLAKLVEWRGDDENGKKVLEDVFREVIVISDDEDSDTEGENQPRNDRDYSVEVVSSNPRVEELRTRPINLANPTLRGTQVEIPEDEALPGFRFVPEIPKKAKIDRRGFSRYQAWDRAINRYRNTTSGPAHQPPLYPPRKPLQESLSYEGEPSLRRPPDSCRLSAAPYAVSNPGPAASGLSRSPLNPVVEHHQYGLFPPVELPHKINDAPLYPGVVRLERVPVSDQGKHPPIQRPDSPTRPIFVTASRDIRERNDDYSRAPPRPLGPLHSANFNPQDRVLPSVESPLPMEIKRPNSGHIDQLTQRMSGAFSFRSETPKRPAYQGFPSPKFEDPNRDHAPKRRRMTHHETAIQRSPCSGIVTTTAVEYYPGGRYAIAGQSSGQIEPSCRRYVAPVDGLHIAERPPGSALDLATYPTQLNRSPQFMTHQAPTKRYNGHLSSHSRPTESYTHPRSPNQTHIVSDTRPPIPLGSGYDGAIPARLPDSREPRIYRSVPSYNVGDVRPLDVTQPQNDPSWRRNPDPQRVLVPYRSAEKEGLYADGFVRTVDMHEPGRLEYPPVRRQPSSKLVDSPPQAVNSRVHSHQHRRVPSDSVMSVPARARVQLDSPAISPSQQYPVVDDRGARYHDNRPFRTPPITHQYERRYEDTLPPPRYDDNQDPSR